ncbi:MAG: ABC transporter substrate-binding protein [Armatimonadota bacterium]|nr:ABC transporter substrate-binding protein [Armatimonadota bacterium]
MAKRRRQQGQGKGASRRKTRREFLRMAGQAALGLALGATAPAVLAKAGRASQAVAAGGPTIIVQSPRQIVVSTWGGLTEEGLRKIVTPAFERKYRATVTYDIGGAAARYNKLRAQAANPQINIIFNVEDILVDAAERGLLAKFDPRNVPNIKDVYPWATPASLQGHGAAYSVLAYGLMVARGRSSLPVTSWHDLWRPEFRGRLAIASPLHSQTPQLLIVASELFGGSQTNVAPGLAALGELRPIRQSIFWTDYAAFVKSGDVIISTEFDYYVLFMQKEGYDVSWVLPLEKAFGSLQYAAIVKGAPNQELAEGYLNTLLDPEIQSRMAREIFNPPTNRLVKLDPPLSEQVVYGPRLQAVRWFDAKFINANRARWLERINTEVVPKWRV